MKAMIFQDKEFLHRKVVKRMAKTLELTFSAANGKQSKLTLGEPQEPIDLEAMKTAMDSIIAAGVFTTANGDLISPKGARVIERNVTEYEL